MERNTMIEKSISYFHAHYDELTEQYGHKYLLIYDGNVICAFDDELTALKEGSKRYLLGTFAVQETGVENIPHIGPIIWEGVK